MRERDDELPTVPLTFRLEKRLADKLEGLAERQHRTKSNLIGMLLTEALANALAAEKQK